MAGDERLDPRQSGMRRFWDRRARENAFFFVDNRLDYRHPDVERFWADGARDLDTALESLGVSLQRDEHVLEIGCGVGRLTRVLAARSESVTALDISPQMLDMAQQLNPGLTNVEWLLGDGSTLAGIASASVDACISHVVFQHIPDPAITLGYVREMGRVLRPGGWAAFQLSNEAGAGRRSSVATRMKHAALRLIGRAPRGLHDPAWLGSTVELDDVRRAATEGSMGVERMLGEGTQFCFVLTRRLAD